MAIGSSIGSHYDDLFTLLGVTQGNTDLGTFTGSTIADNDDIKGALQALEDGLSTIYTANGTLSGNRIVTLGGNDLTFSGTKTSVIKSDGWFQTPSIKYGSPASPAEGDVWFDSDTQEMVIAVSGIGATESVWTSGGNMTVCMRNTSGFGNQNAAGFATGIDVANCACTEIYDGTSFSSGDPINLARRQGASSGVFTAGLTVGGYTTVSVACVEEFDGSVWSNGGAIGTGTVQHQLTGGQTAALKSGGYTTGWTDCTEEYNGSTWSAGGNYPQTMRFHSSFGLQTATISAAGECSTGTRVSCGYCYNGTSWSTNTAYPFAMSRANAGGISTNGFITGGTCGTDLAATYIYNGATYSADADLITARHIQGVTGAVGRGLTAGGQNGSSDLQSSEEYTCVDIMPFQMCFI